MALTTVEQVKAAYLAVNRVALNDATAAAVAASIDGGTTSILAYQNGLVAQAATTTQAAVALSSFFEGVVPTSARVDSLTAFAKTQNDYYTNVLKSSNAQLGAFEALGKAFAADPTTTVAFAAKYGALSATNFVNNVYAQVFNNSPVPSAGALANLVGQIAYFTDLYTKAGIPAAQADIQAKGAVLGQIIGYAVTATDATTEAGSSFDDGVATALATLATEARTEVTPSTVYGKALSGAGATIAIAADGSVSLDVKANGAAPGNVTATAFADTVSGTISGSTKDISVNTAAGNDSIGTKAANVTVTQAGAFKIAIDGSAGDDVLYATLGSDLTANTTIANVEKLYFATGAGINVAATNFSGVQELWNNNSAGVLAVTDVKAGVTVGVDSAAAGSTFTYAAGVADAKLALSGATGGVTTVNGNATDLKTLNVDVVKNSITSVATNAETVKVSGAGELAAASLTGANLKTFDASTATKAISLGATATAVNFGGDSTIKFGAGNDTFFIATNDQDKDVVTLGAGNDFVTVTGLAGNVAFTDGALTKMIEFTDFTKGSDKIVFTGVVKSTANLTGILTEQAALTAVAAVAAEDKVFFEFNGSTYIFNDVAAAGSVTAADGIVKLTGFTGAVLGTDILAA